MAVIKQKTRKKLSKQLGRLVKRHGAEMTLALVTGIISSLAAARADKVSKKAKEAARAEKGKDKEKLVRTVKVVRPAKAARPAVVVRRRATA